MADINDVPALEMSVASEAPAWAESDQALIAHLEREDGHLIVAFKDPASVAVEATAAVREIRGRTHLRGTRAAVSRSAIIAGLQLLEKQGATLLRYLGTIGAAHVQLDPQSAPALLDNPLIDYIAPRERAQLAAQSTDWGMHQIRGPSAWGVHRGSGASILIIDSGHQRDHEDLPLVPEENCGGAYGGCSDNSDIGWHGTHVMGIATMRDNYSGYVGAANGVAGADAYVWGACYYDPVYQTGSCSSDQIASGIDAGVIWGVDVINMSLGGPNDTAIANAVAAADASGVLMVAAAGNNMSNVLRYPAAFPEVIGVSGTNQDRTFAGYGTTACGGWSNNGSHVDLAAPFEAWSTIGYDTYEKKCGTSMSTPHVAGVIALLRAKLPALTADSVKNRLFNTAADEGPAGWDDKFGYGIVDAAAALSLLTASVQGPTYINQEGSYTWDATVSGGEGKDPGDYSYQWEIRYDDLGPSWGPVGGNSPSVTFNVDGSDGDFTLRVTVTAPDAQETVSQIAVINAAGCGQLVIC